MYSLNKTKPWFGTNGRITTQVFFAAHTKFSSVFCCSLKKINRVKNLMSRNSIEVTCLNGETLGSYENQDNPVLNRISQTFPSRPGLYMIHCLQNDWRYYGETQNLQARKSSHQSLLKRKIHANSRLQADYNSFGSDTFRYLILHVGDQWQDVQIRRKKELEYIFFNSNCAYNVYAGSREGEMNPFWGRLHSEDSKKAMSESSKGIPNLELGRKIFIPPSGSKRLSPPRSGGVRDSGRFVQGGEFPSIAEASRLTGFSRKLIRNRLLSPEFPEWKEIE